MSRLYIPDYVLYVCDTLRSAEYEAYVVGGGVRDAMLGRDPKDWDVATSAPPEEVQRLFPKTVATGIEFGTVTVLVEGELRGAEKHTRGENGADGAVASTRARDGTTHAVEVTTFRGESGYVDGRRPDSVQFIGSIEDDLVRRDFTVNAIAYEPDKNVIVDPYEGQADLANKLIRAVGDPNERFQEDGLRVLRAVRIAVELGFSIEENTRRALRRHGARLLQISRERIGQEWRRLLQTPDAGRGLLLLHELALLPFVFPGTSAACSTPSAVANTSAALQRGRCLNVATKTAIVLHGLGTREQHQHWLNKLVYPKQIARETLHVVRFLRSFNPEKLTTDIDLRRYLHRLGRPYVTAFLHTHAAWHPGDEAQRLRERIDSIVARGDALAVNELAVDGHDVQAVLPGTSGPAVGAMLDRLLDHVLSHPADNKRERLVTLMRTWAEQPEGSSTSS